MIANYTRSGTIEPIPAARLLELQLSAFRWIGLGVSVLCLLGFGVGRCFEAIPFLADSMFLQALVLLAPGVAITVGTWSAEHLYGVQLKYTDPSVGNYVSSIWRSFRGGMAWLVMPVLLLLLMIDAISVLPLHQTGKSMVTLVAVGLFIPIALPWLVRRLFQTEPMGEVHSVWVPDLMRRAGAGGTKVVRWNTNGNSFNAMVAGFLPPVKSLFISDRILDELPDEQIAMIVLHEAAHLKRFHVPLRMVAVIPAWLAGLMITRVGGGQSWAMAAGSVVGVLLTLLILRLVAYRTEHDADRVACRTAVELSNEFEQLPKTHQQASEAMGAALLRVTQDHPASQKPTWLHPGVQQRIDVIEQVFESRCENALA